MILVETSVLVDILRKKSKILDFIQDLGTTPLYTTEICVMELIYGIMGSKVYATNPELKDRRIREVNQLCVRFTVLHFDRKAAIKTAEIMGRLKLIGKLIDFRDGMIAGTGLANEIKKLLTLNPKHFKNIHELEVISFT
ncbi:MAG: type II toxin-antitoxin system VapC family toxin [Candidatus Hodarchaeales archaeon]